MEGGSQIFNDGGKNVQYSIHMIYGYPKCKSAQNPLIKRLGNYFRSRYKKLFSAEKRHILKRRSDGGIFSGPIDVNGLLIPGRHLFTG